VINQFNIKLPAGMCYQAGNVVQILPENPLELTERVLEALKIPPDDVYKVTQNGTTMDNIVPQKVTARQLFTQYLDLNGPPPRTVFRAFSHAANDKGQARIASLLDPKEESQLKAYIKQKKNTAGVVCDLAQYGVPAMDALLSSVPQIRPRTYQIMSVPLKSRGHIQLCVGRQVFGVDGERLGLCTGFLEQPQRRRVALRIRPGKFQQPEDRGTPLIVVGIGIGVLPFKPIIEDRDPSHGPLLLVYGTRTREESQFMVDILDGLKKANQITDLIYVFSRENPEKRVHVQDVLMENMPLLWKYWQDPTCRMYYAGSWAAVCEELKRIMLETTISQGGVNEATAQEFNASHQFAFLNYWSQNC
jgi:sulfite reductase alpha subunit-like flavoprotein